MMRRMITGFAAVLLCGELSAECCCPCDENSIFFIGGSYTRSHIDPKGFSNFDGNMGGVQGMYQYRPLQSFYFAIGGYWRAGKNTGRTGTRDLVDAGVHERIGYTFATCDSCFLFTPYTGFGYRHLSHHVKPKNGNRIKLRYNEFFIPVGFLTIYDLFSCVSIGLDAVWMPQVFPTVTFNVVDGARWVIKSTYKNFNVALPLYFHFSSCSSFDVVLSPFFEYWEDGQTTARTQFNDPLGLPKNSYIFWGINLNLQYAF
ncbi:MAG: hypothetical protein JSS30_03885 [Verrucomicrobia bacterium]|nr:hypothetical protein [Verrucomicrobiota bacterium]